MASTLLTTTTTTSSPLLKFHNLSRKQVVSPCSSLHIRKPTFSYTSCKLEQTKQDKKQEGVTDRRNVLMGLGGLCAAAAAAASLFNKDLIANAGYAPASMQYVSEFGSQPRTLHKPIRALVERPKEKDGDEDEDAEEQDEVLIVDGIEIPSNGPIRFDVYVGKPNGGVTMDSDYGELAGSMVDIAHTRVGRNAPKGSLELGITELVEDIEAGDSDTLVVTLVPRMGQVIIGGVRIEAW